jgi:hypothetical protein
MRSYAACALVLTLFFPACGGNEAPVEEPVRNAATPPGVIVGRPLTLDELVNATYIATDQKRIELKNGEWTDPDPAVNRKITLLRTNALSGDLNGDGNNETVGFYSDRVGTVETFNFAVLVVTPDGLIHVIASATVGTGVALVSARIAEQKIVVEVRSNGKTERLQWEMKDGVLKTIEAP